MSRSCDWSRRYVDSGPWLLVIVIIVGLAAMLSEEYQNNQFMRSGSRRIFALRISF